MNVIGHAYSCRYEPCSPPGIPTKTETANPPPQPPVALQRRDDDDEEEDQLEGGVQRIVAEIKDEDPDEEEETADISAAGCV